MDRGVGIGVQYQNSEEGSAYFVNVAEYSCVERGNILIEAQGDNLYTDEPTKAVYY